MTVQADVMNAIALDVGGANLKAADGCGFAVSRSFPLWRAPERLADELRALIAAAPRADRIAVTMTGELADCYETKSIGVGAILDAIDLAAGGRPVAVYLTEGRFATSEEARGNPLAAAASNWRALAEFANRFVNEWPVLLLDLGTTTADVIPLAASGPSPQGCTDTNRLLSR